VPERINSKREESGSDGCSEAHKKALSCRKRVQNCRNRRARIVPYIHGTRYKTVAREEAKAGLSGHDQYELDMIAEDVLSDLTGTDRLVSKSSPNHAATIPPKKIPHSRKRSCG
jgi:hypothetical protein